jgi:uncharacterized repeat protein (TIGR01451 family)
MRVVARLGTALLTASILLLGYSSPAFAASADPASVDFGSVPLGTTVSRSITITVDAGYTLFSAGGVSALNPPYSFNFGTCGGFVGPGTCTVNESFTPTTPGTTTADLTLSEVSGGSVITIPVHFTGIGVIPQADLAVSIATASKPIAQSKLATFTITVHAFGPATAADVSLTTAVPTGSLFVSATPSQGTCTAPPAGSTGTIVCTLGTMTSGADATLTLTVDPSGKKLILTNSATVSSSTSDPVSANNSATASIQIK